jgi:hypothetical protein
MDDEGNLWHTSGANVITKVYGIWDSHALFSLASLNGDVDTMEDSTYWVDIDLLDLSSFFEWDPSIFLYEAQPSNKKDLLDKEGSLVKEEPFDEEDPLIPIYA